MTMESWNTAWVPSYRLVAGPIRKPDCAASFAGLKSSRIDRVREIRTFASRVTDRSSPG